MIDVDWRELLWFISVTITLHGGLVVLLVGALALVEKYGLFKEARIQTEPLKFWQPEMWRCVKHVAYLHLVFQPLGLPAFYAIMKWRGMPFSGPAPPLLQMALEIAAFFLIEDTGFYWTHRLLHQPFLYKSIHKFHHRYKQPIGLAAEYTHPLEYVFANSIPQFLGPLLFRCHIVTFWVWLAIRITEAVDGHSGYDFWFVPFRYFPFRPGTQVHDYHHSHNVGNYSSFFIFWDWICGTDMSYRDYQLRRKDKLEGKEGGKAA